MNGSPRSFILLGLTRASARHSLLLRTRAAQGGARISESVDCSVDLEACLPAVEAIMGSSMVNRHGVIFASSKSKTATQSCRHPA